MRLGGLEISLLGGILFLWMIAIFVQEKVLLVYWLVKGRHAVSLDRLDELYGNQEKAV